MRTRIVRNEERDHGGKHVRVTVVDRTKAYVAREEERTRRGKRIRVTVVGSSREEAPNGQAHT